MIASKDSSSDHARPPDAERIHSLRYEDLSPTALDRTRAAFIDTVGVRAVMARVSARPHPPHPHMPDNLPLQWGAEVVVTTRDGKRLASRLDDFERRGSGGQSMTREGLWEKFEDCPGRSLPIGNIAPLFDLPGRIEALADITDLTRLLEQPEAAMRRIA